MRAQTKYNGLPVIICQTAEQIKTLIQESGWLTEMGIYEPITVTIQAADGSAAFPNPETHQPYQTEINIPVSSLEFIFDGTYDEGIKIAEWRGHRDNNFFGKMVSARMPELAMKMTYRFETETLKLFLQADNQSPAEYMGTWQLTEHTVTSYLFMNFGE